MKLSEKVEKIKRKALELFELRENLEEYRKKAWTIADKIQEFKLEDEMHGTELVSVLMNPVKKKDISRVTYEEFRKSIENYFMIKETDYYFHLVELTKFPKEYTLGYGKLLDFDSLPQQVKKCVENLAKGKVMSESPATEKVWKQIIPKLVIPENSQVGHWLKVPVSSISWTKRMDRAFEHAEESLDILRIAISTARFHLPQYAIAYDKENNEAYPVVKGVEFSRYPYDKHHQGLIDILNNLLLANTNSDLKKRIKNAFYFYRIAGNNAPKHQKIFFYVAAIENLILGGNDRGVLRWKFSEKGAILLSNDREKRLKKVKELKALYDERSQIAHGSTSEYDFFLTNSSRSYLRQIIFKLIKLINTHNLETVSANEEKPNQSLDEYVNNIIFSS